MLNIFFILAKPNVTTNCSRTVELDEGDDMKCLCTGEGGNPPTSLTWNKDGVRIGYIKYEKNLLIIRNIGKNDSGRYNCIGESHSQKEEKSIQVIVSCTYPIIFQIFCLGFCYSAYWCIGSNLFNF